ncbi:MAG: DUF1987 domain-containing protein [Bacteroidia bacterium]|nr:DUF1987 domain-containing protein [Bacteroidia bacterium]
MEILSIEETQRSPAVVLDPFAGKIEFRGRSIMDNPLAFYRPIYEWFEKYKIHPCNVTQVEIQMEYFNTSSSKCLLDVFRYLIDIQTAGDRVSVNWYYADEDDDMLEIGEDFQSVVSIPFNMKKFKR